MFGHRTPNKEETAKVKKNAVSKTFLVFFLIQNCITHTYQFSKKVQLLYPTVLYIFGKPHLIASRDNFKTDHKTIKIFMAMQLVMRNFDITLLKIG
jgi:hypothetical protein